MQTVSTGDKALAEGYGKITLRLYVDGGEVTGLGAATYTGACGDEDGFTIGNACACGMEMVISGAHPGYEGKPFRVTWSVSETEYPLISGTLGLPAVSAGQTTVQGYDAMYWAGSSALVAPSSLKADCTAGAALRHIADQMGVTLEQGTETLADTVTITDGLTNLPEDCSLSQGAGLIAGLLGGNAQISRAGELCIRRFPASGFATQPYSGGASAQSQDYTPGGVTFQREVMVTKYNADGTTSEDLEPVEYSSGTTPRVMVENALATQADADRAAEIVQGLSIRRGTYEFPGGILLEPGDLITIQSMDGDYTVLCSSISLELDGGARCTVTSAGQADSGGYAGSIGQQLAELTADLARVRHLVAENAEITSAKISNLSADDITAGAIHSTDFAVTNLPLIYPASWVYPTDTTYPSNGEQITRGFEIDFAAGVIRGKFYGDVIDAMTNTLNTLTERVSNLSQEVETLKTRPLYPIKV